MSQGSSQIGKSIYSQLEEVACDEFLKALTEQPFNRCLATEEQRWYSPYALMMSEILGIDGVSEVNIQDNGTARLDPYTQIPPMSIRVIVEADVNLKTKKVAKAIENWRFAGVGLTGNTSVKIKVGPKGSKMKRCVKFEWVKV